MICNVPYIEERFRESNPDIADILNQEYETIFNKLIESKLFKNEDNTLKLSYAKTKKYLKQLDFINNINQEYETEIVTNINRTISVNVLPLYNKLDVINKPKYYMKDNVSVKTNINLERVPVQQVIIDINKEILDTVTHVLEFLNSKGFNPVIVGGAVRDAIVGDKPKDIDIEVYGITVEDLESILSSYGKVDAVGKSFGVLKFIPYDANGKLVELEEPFDFSVPRRENKVGVGYKGFEIELSDDISIEEAATRRDFTWNSMGYNPITNTLYDYYGGINDLAEGIIRHTSPKFAEDPLRILRALQFQARKGHVIAPETYELMSSIVNRGEFDHLVTKNIYDKWSKRKQELLKEKDLFDNNKINILKQLINNYNSFGILYHGTSSEEIKDEILPYTITGNIQEKDRKKNLDKVFFSKSKKSANIYAGRAFNTYGGIKVVHSVIPVGDIETINSAVGTEVYMSDYAIVIDETKNIESQFKKYIDSLIFPLQEEYDQTVYRISRERITGEWNKWATKGKYHSKIFDFLRQSELGEKLYPELLTLRDTMQDTVYHPEGNVEEHTKQVMAKANEIAEREKLSVEEKQILMLSALLHDIAKPETTKEEWSDKLNRFKVTSRGHEQAGEAIALDFLERIGIKEDVRVKIGKLVAEHLAHATISSLTAGKQKKSAFAKLVNRLAPANVEQLVMLMEADMLGRNNNNLDTPVSITEFMGLLEDYKNTNKGKLSFEPILTGKHLIKAGIKPGKGMGEILAKAKEAQLNLDFTDETESLEWLSNYLSTQDNDTILLEDKVKGTNMKELGVKTVISNIRTLLPKSNVELLNTLIESIKQNESSPILILAQMSREYKNGALDKADLLTATFDKMADKNKEAIMVAIKSSYNVSDDNDVMNKLGELLVDKDNAIILNSGILGSLYRGVHNFFNSFEGNKEDIVKTISTIYDIDDTITDDMILHSERFKLFNKNNPYTSEKENLEYFKKCT